MHVRELAEDRHVEIQCTPYAALAILAQALRR
jgi:hypothetical protein